MWSRLISLALFLLLTIQVDARQLEKVGGFLYWQDNAERVLIKERNSPENALIETELDMPRALEALDQANSMGLNTIYVIGFSGDDQRVHPFLNRNNPSQGFNEQRIALWRQYFEYWVSLGNDHMIHFCLLEAETLYTLNDTQQQAYFKRMLDAFSDLPMIWDMEEVESNGAWLRKWYGFLRQNTTNILAVHNRPYEQPWRLLTNEVDLVSFQGALGETAPMQDAASRGFAVYASEITPWQVGISPGNVVQTLAWFTAEQSVSSGAGFYLGTKDQTAFLDLSPWSANFAAINQPNLNEINNYWWRSAGVESIAIPEFNLNQIVADDYGMFGFIESRYPIKLTTGLWECRVSTTGANAATVRIRVFHHSNGAYKTYLIDSTPSNDTHSVFFFATGQEDWFIAVDLLTFFKEGDAVTITKVELLEA